MTPIPVIAIFDVGKTNKKLFLFDENYRIVYEKSARFTETEDEDGFPCENIESLRLSVADSMVEILRMKQFRVMAVNFSTYGASLVYIDSAGEPVFPLYNYLKPYPEALSAAFYGRYGGEATFSIETASPVSGSLNSGLQLFRLQNEQPELFSKVQYALHLPQYMSYLLSGIACSDLTSIGCHTGMWNFNLNSYHDWVRAERLSGRLAPIVCADQVHPSRFSTEDYQVGVGLHDSSASLVPYLINFKEPFVLVSTGTWCISLNPFNQEPLTAEQLENDCLCYIQYQGKPVKASRLFSGSEHEQQVNRIASHFNVDNVKFRKLVYNADRLDLRKQTAPKPGFRRQSDFATRDLNQFGSYKKAYHQLIYDLVELQAYATRQVLEGSAVRRIFVDGGFSKNSVYMNMLAQAFPEMEVFAASMAQATALGAAIVLHSKWNSKPLPANLIELNYYVSNAAIPVK